MVYVEFRLLILKNDAAVILSDPNGISNIRSDKVRYKDQKIQKQKLRLSNPN